jgi:hypothetical protein
LYAVNRLPGFSIFTLQTVPAYDTGNHSGHNIEKSSRYLYINFGGLFALSGMQSSENSLGHNPLAFLIDGYLPFHIQKLYGSVEPQRIVTVFIVDEPAEFGVAHFLELLVRPHRAAALHRTVPAI